MTRVTLLAAMVGIGAVGCGHRGDVTVHGEVVPGDQPATELQGQAPAGDADRARVSRVEQDGSTQVLAESDVEADGSFTAVVPAGEVKLVVEAVDASGTVVASGLLASTGSGDALTLPTLDAESTLEALVYVDLVASGASTLADADPCDLRARIDARVAASAEPGSVQTLSAAIAAAQSARSRAWDELGVAASAEDAFEAELDAVARLDAALAAGTDASAAEAQYLSDLASAAASLGASAAAHAEATSQETLALRASALGSLEGPVLLAAARAEARASGDAAIDAAASAGPAADHLRAAVDAALTADAADAAFADFQAELVGDGSVHGSVLADALGLDLAGELTAEIAVGAALTAGDALQATVGGAKGEAEGDAAELAVGAWATYRAAIEVAAATLPDAELSATLLVCATGSFR